MKTLIKINLVLISLLLLGFTAAMFAQQKSGNDHTITSQFKEQTVNKITKMLTENYVFPDKAKE
jgi:NADH:ubiquinone oxidoreductase subunit 6 (subunit J)